jgi:hypothetical protein
MPEEPLIINPHHDDEMRTESVLGEIREIMAKRGYCLLHREDAMLLVKVQSDTLMVGRAVAYVKQINPKLFEWKAIDWAGDFMKKGNS